ncbi:hypothetical protein SAMN05444050_1261 [Afipia sp. GAS231]|nr:hypothetical protein SAMN05444050_1261 [Afipia sp. GAS231]
MTSRNAFDAFAAARGDGLHPKLRELFDRSAALPFSELTVRGDGLLQAGPDPASERLAVPSNATISVEVEANAPLAIRSIRGGKKHPAQE